MSTTPPPAAPPGRLYDMGVVFIVGVLMTLGVAMVYSATVTVQGAALSWREIWTSPLKQGVYALAGFLAMLVAAHLDYRVLAWRGTRGGWGVWLLMVLAVGLLVAVLCIGHVALGARRQIMLPGLGFGFQPSEIAKVVLVVWLAALMTRPLGGPRAARFPIGGKTVTGGPARGDVRDFKTGFLPAVISAGLLAGLTAIEDFGTAALMGVVMLALLVVGGARWRHMGLLVLLGIAACVLLVLIEPYRLERIRTFFTPTPDTAGAGYQVHQALLAIGSGGWWGVGLGAGVQKYGYLPQDNNDFILAIICEELGIIGGLFVVALFVLILWRGWCIAAGAPDLHGRLLAVGLTLMICVQAAINVAVVTNSVPTKGISLPFVSAGGSGVVFLGLAAGLLAAVGRRRRRPATA